jgi:hypothetical protein
MTFDHDMGTLTDDNSPAELMIYQEGDVQKNGAAAYIAKYRPFELPKSNTVTPLTQKVRDMELPKIGISIVACSSDSRFLATKNENFPQCVWIWDLTKLQLCTILV